MATADPYIDISPRRNAVGDGDAKQRLGISGASTHSTAERDARLRLDLEREGRCSDCGIQTHRLSHRTVKMASARGLGEDAVIVHKEPLTIGEEVHHGRCLLCRPFSENSTGSLSRSNSSNGNDFAYASSRAPIVQPQQPPAAEPHPAQQQPLLLHVIAQEESDLQRGADDDEGMNEDDDEILTILLRMRRSPQDLALQISSFHSLWVLSWETENARAIGRVGGIHTLLESLRYHLHVHLNINNRYNRNNHTSSPSALQRMQLQANGMATLQNLSVNKYNKELLMENDSPGISLITLSMTAFLHNAEIVSSGCNAMANILSNGKCYRLNILNHGALNVILRGTEFHKDNEGVVRAAYKCLCLLGQKTTARREFQRMQQAGDETDDERSVDGEDGGNNEEEDDDAVMVDMDVSARSALSTCSE